MFNIPNYADATWEAQARVFSTDLAILSMAAGGQNGVISGCEVTAQSPESMSVDVDVGTVKIAGVQEAVPGNSVTIDDASGTYPRLDVIYVNDSGIAAVSTGTAAPEPTPNALPADSIGLAFVYVPTSDTTIGTGQITDKRVLVQAPLGESQWTTISKAGDESRTNDASLSNDGDLTFAMAANTKYRIRAHLLFSVPAADAGARWSVNGPSAPTLVRVLDRHTYLQDSYMTAWYNSATENMSVIGAYDSTTGISRYSSAAATLWVSLEATVHNGANSGTFAIMWAQENANALSTVLRAGSYLEYEVA